MLSTSPHGARRLTPELRVGLRPALLAEPHVVGRVLRHGGEPIEEHVPLVQILDALVPQMEDQVADNLNLEDDVLDVARLMDLPISEQVIEVPKISCSSCPSRSPIPEPELAEQLVEVSTVLSPTRIALQIAEQIADTPVPRGRGEGRVQGSLPRQSSTATPSVEERISERIVEQFSSSSAKRTSERIEEQLVDTSPGVGLGQGSSSSAGPADEDFAGFFSHFSPWEKSARAAASPSAELPREVSSWTPAAYAETIGSDERVQFSQQGKPFYWKPTLPRDLLDPT